MSPFLPWLLLAGLALADPAPVDLNTADAATLAALDGLSAAQAAAVVAHRAEHGPFGRLEDLARVPGVGPRELVRLRSAVVVGTSRAPTPGPPVARHPASVDLNAAGLQGLQRLPGVGPTKAAAILAFREANGPFASCAALADVPGLTVLTVQAVAVRCHVGP